jgi:predicted Zn-ribbon and HTH transcriptional regulator
MQPCQNCQAVIDEYTLDKQLEPLRELTVDDFNVCGDCVTIADDACVACGGAVYVPRSADARPDFCPACRSDRIERTGRDPGWHLESPSTT